MEKKKQEGPLRQWHSAFYDGLQIELMEDCGNLIFENEHQLGTKPKAIDVLVIKKNTEKAVSKNLGRIFKKHNIVEYKGPGDYLSVNDFYKTYAYTCFYKAETKFEDEIPITDITITMVCLRYPRKLAKHLREIRHFRISQHEEGIYYIECDFIPIQIIVTSELTEEKNLWLRSLREDIEKGDTAQKLITDYRFHKENRLYESVMGMIVKANRERFEEVDGMCEALEEVLEVVMKDKIEARLQKAEEQGMARGIERGMAQGIERGMAQGIERGMAQGIEQGIRALILDNLEEGFSLERICEKLQRRFLLTEEKARKYIEQVREE